MVLDVNKKNAVLGRAALLLTTLIWGTSFVILKNTLDTVPTLYILAFRFSGAAILMLPFILKDIKKLDKKYLINGALMGVFLFGGYTVQTFGLVFTTPSKNAFLTASYCVLVPYVSWVIEKKHPSIFNVSAAIICLIGVGFVSLKNDLTIGIGDILTVCCGLFYAIHMVLTSKYVNGRSVLLLTTVQFSTAGVLAWALALLTGRFPTNIPAGNAWGIVYLCVMSTALCFVLQTFGQKHISSTTASIILTLESVFGAAFSVLVYHEKLSIRLIIGFVLIFAAVLISETKLSFFKSKRKINETTEYNNSNIVN